jgi:hypothetical protein
VGEAWSDDFEGNACGWELINGELTNAWVWGTAANNGGAYGLYISNDGGITNAYTVNSAAMVYAAKLLSFTEGKFDFSYNWLCNGEGTYDYLESCLGARLGDPDRWHNASSWIVHHFCPHGLDCFGWRRQAEFEHHLASS